MRKHYIVIGDDEEGEVERYKCFSYTEAISKANEMADSDYKHIIVCEVKAEIVLSKKVVEY